MMKHAAKRFLSLVAAGALSVGLLTQATGCGKGSGGGGAAGLKIMYTMCSLDDYRNLLLDSVKSSASAAGVDLDVQEECLTVDAQLAQVQAAAKGGYDALICLPVDSETALQLEVAAGGMPIVYVNSLPSSDHLKADKYMYVGSYEWDAGRYQAEYVWDKLGKPKELNAIIFEGQQGHAGTIGRTGAVKEFFRNNGVNANFVFCDYATWSDVIAAEKFEVFLKTKQDFEAIFCNNDTMAIGVVGAMKEHGFSTEDIPVCGVDATEAGCQSIVDGGMQFTVYQSAAGQGEMAVKTAVALATKGTAKGIEGLSDDGKIVWVPFEKVDASNVKDYMK